MMMRFSSILAIIFAFLTIGTVHATYTYSRDDAGNIDVSIAAAGVIMTLVFAVLTFVFWRRTVISKQNEDDKNTED